MELFPFDSFANYMFIIQLQFIQNLSHERQAKWTHDGIQKYIHNIRLNCVWARARPLFIHVK